MSDPVRMISDQAALAACCTHWHALGRFAFDTEFIRDETFDARLCLVQVSDGEEVVLIDPLARGLDLAPFWELVTDPNVLTIVHAGKEDFEVCLRACGAPPRNVFDVQIAAGLVGFGYPLSLVRLAEAAVHKRISKGSTLTDWSRRPLTDDQLRYAEDDVRHLPAIERRISKLLAKHNRTDWAAEEFLRFEDAHFYDPPIEDRLFKLKGSRRLDGLGLAVLQRLIAWRDNWAREANRPLRALVRDDVLVEMARRRPTRPEQLEVLRGFPQARNRQVVARLLAEIADAARTPRSDWPQIFEQREETPLLKATTEILSACTRSVCEEAGVANELFGSAQRLRDLLDFLKDQAARPAADSGANSKPEASGSPAELPALLRGWRRDFLGLQLVDLVEGRCELHLSGWPNELRIQVVQTAAAPAPRATPADAAKRR